MRVARGTWSARFDEDQLRGAIDADFWRRWSHEERCYVVDLLGSTAQADPVLHARLEAAHEAGDGRAFGDLIAEAVSRRLSAGSN
jgi:hypothetical protein